MGYPRKTLAAVAVAAAAGVAAVVATLATITTLNVANLYIGTGATAITKHVSATSSLDFAAVPASYCTSSSMALTGAVAGDTASLSIPAAIAGVSTSTASRAGIIWRADIIGTDLASVEACNVSSTAATADLASGTFRVDAWHH